MCHSMMGLTRCYKTAVFTFLFAVFRSQSIAEIQPLPHLENKRTPYGNSTSGFEFELFTVANILLLSGFMTSRLQEGKELFAY